jgi:hypothetical protein
MWPIKLNAKNWVVILVYNEEVYMGAQGERIGARGDAAAFDRKYVGEANFREHARAVPPADSSESKIRYFFRPVKQAFEHRR